MEPKLNKIHQEVKYLLEAFGYKPLVTTYRDYNGEDRVDLHFHVDGGFDAMPTRHKDAVIMLAKGYLSELYYGQDTQHVRLYSECKGLNPDDERYGCLLHEIRLVSPDEPHLRKGIEVFVNMGDHFKRFVNWEDVTSKD